MQRMVSPASVNGFCRKGDSDNEPLELIFMKDFFKHNRFLLFAVALASVVTFSSCGDDDCDCDKTSQSDPLPNLADTAVEVKASEVMENWVLDSEKLVLVSKGKETVDKEYEYSTDFYHSFFNGANGYCQTCTTDGYCNNTGTWKYSAGYIYVYRYSNAPIVYTIIQHTDKEMILRYRTGDKTSGVYIEYKYLKIGSINAYLEKLKEQKEQSEN